MRSMRGFGAALVVSALIAAPTAWAQKVQPGEGIRTDVGGCTLNWIYDGAGGPYVGTAAHCVSGVGDPVFFANGSGGRIGEVAFRGDPNTEGRDYALIHIDPAQQSNVDPSMKGHPSIPTGVSTGYAEGDVVQFSGYGIVFDLTPPTREQRIGLLNWTDGVEHQIIGPVTPGDSGGPVADGGAAFGIVTQLIAGVNTDALAVVEAGEAGENLDFVLSDAAAHGFPVSLRTAG